jgi:hypothetical protein
MNNEKKYIKIVTYDNFPFGGAPANYLRYFALSLSLNEKNDVEVIMPTGNFYANKTDLNNSKTGQIEKIKYRHLCYVKHPKKFFGKLLDNLCGIALPLIFFLNEHIKKKVDVIIVYNTGFFATLTLLLIKKITNKKLIIILPECYEKPTKLYSLAGFHWLSFYIGITYLVQYADKFIVLTDYLKNYLISKNIQQERILV